MQAPSPPDPKDQPPHTAAAFSDLGPCSLHYVGSALLNWASRETATLVAAGAQREEKGLRAGRHGPPRQGWGGGRHLSSGFHRLRLRPRGASGSAVLVMLRGGRPLGSLV